MTCATHWAKRQPSGNGQMGCLRGVRRPKPGRRMGVCKAEPADRLGARSRVDTLLGDLLASLGPTEGRTPGVCR